jgi:hypothetical protein
MSRILRTLKHVRLLRLSWRKSYAHLTTKLILSRMHKLSIRVHTLLETRL